MVKELSWNRRETEFGQKEAEWDSETWYKGNVPNPAAAHVREIASGNQGTL